MCVKRNFTAELKIRYIHKIRNNVEVIVNASVACTERTQIGIASVHHTLTKYSAMQCVVLFFTVSEGYRKIT